MTLPSPVNLIGAMSGARFGPRRALPFVTGATFCFLALLLGLGLGLVAGIGWIGALAKPMTLAGSAWLLWLAWGLARGGAGPEAGGMTTPPGFWSGVAVQGLNPKAWAVVISALSTFVLPLDDRRTGLAVFAALFTILCWLSLAAWVWGAARLALLAPRSFNRAMAILLALSVVWMLAGAF